jgi:hypothetical protein
MPRIHIFSVSDNIRFGTGVIYWLIEDDGSDFYILSSAGVMKFNKSRYYYKKF